MRSGGVAIIGLLLPKLQHGKHGVEGIAPTPRTTSQRHGDTVQHGAARHRQHVFMVALVAPFGLRTGFL